MPEMSCQNFNIPNVPPDLRREETVHQIADSLNYLDQVANEVFKRISNKLNENRTRLQRVNDRISLAQAKVDKIKGSNKATKVFASAKYPVSEDLEEYGLIFPLQTSNGLREIKRPHYRVSSKHKGLDDKSLKEKLQFYNVHLKLKHKNDASQKDGLGGLPKSVPSISSLLLFNTSENLYKQYTMLDPLGVVKKTRTAMEEESEIDAAPTTITTNEGLQGQKVDDISFKPVIVDFPEIAVPDFLPNLPGVADDLSFVLDQEKSIAPSVLGSNIPDLPSVVPEETLPSVPEISQPSPNVAPSGGGGGDLMSDLFNRLTMRRKGISGGGGGGGKGGNETSDAPPPPPTGGGGAMDKIASMIPPPPKSGGGGGGDDDDDDWE